MKKSKKPRAQLAPDEQDDLNRIAAVTEATANPHATHKKGELWLEPCPCGKCRKFVIRPLFYSQDCSLYISEAEEIVFRFNNYRKLVEATQVLLGEMNTCGRSCGVSQETVKKLQSITQPKEHRQSEPQEADIATAKANRRLLSDLRDEINSNAGLEADYQDWSRASELVEALLELTP